MTYCWVSYSPTLSPKKDFTKRRPSKSIYCQAFYCQDQAASFQIILFVKVAWWMYRGIMVCNEVQSVACVTNTDNKNEVNTKERMMKVKKINVFASVIRQAKLSTKGRQKKN
jgi:hypothetical protein